MCDAAAAHISLFVSGTSVTLTLPTSHPSWCQRDTDSVGVSLYLSGASVTLKLLGLRARGASILEVVDNSSISFCEQEWQCSAAARAVGSIQSVKHPKKGGTTQHLGP